MPYVAVRTVALCKSTCTTTQAQEYTKTYCTDTYERIFMQMWPRIVDPALFRTLHKALYSDICLLFAAYAAGDVALCQSTHTPR